MNTFGPCLDIVVCLHDLLDARQRQMMNLVVLWHVLNFVHLSRPERLQQMYMCLLHGLVMGKGWFVLMHQWRGRMAHGWNDGVHCLAVYWLQLLLRLLLRLLLLLLMPIRILLLLIVASGNGIHLERVWWCPGRVHTLMLRIHCSGDNSVM